MMMTKDARQRRLLWHAALLILAGLANGVVIPFFRNPRAGLSAHLGGVQNGMLLLLVGLVWGHLHLSPRLRATAFWSSLVSMYGIWIGLVLAAVFGTSRATPIAGKGFAGAPWQEGLVSALVGGGSVAILVGAVVILYGLRGRVGPTS